MPCCKTHYMLKSTIWGREIMVVMCKRNNEQKVINWGFILYTHEIMSLDGFRSQGGFSFPKGNRTQDYSLSKMK